MELYAHRLDPANHCNLLHLFEPDDRTGLRLRRHAYESGHFKAALRAPPANVADIAANFASLRAALAARIETKNRHVRARLGNASRTFDTACLGRIAPFRDAFHLPRELVPD